MISVVHEESEAKAQRLTYPHGVCHGSVGLSFLEEDAVRIISLTRGKVAIIDDEDYERLKGFRYYAEPCVSGKFYAKRRLRMSECGKRGPTRYLHYDIIERLPGLYMDHRNGNSLDNRRGNLRHCTRKQNQANMKPHRDRGSRYKGVSWHREGHKWAAYIRVDEKNKYLGLFMEEEDAARAYDTAARVAFGEFAWCNFEE